MISAGQSKSLEEFKKNVKQTILIYEFTKLTHQRKFYLGLFIVCPFLKLLYVFREKGKHLTPGSLATYNTIAEYSTSFVVGFYRTSFIKCGVTNHFSVEGHTEVICHVLAVDRTAREALPPFLSFSHHFISISSSPSRGLDKSLVQGWWKLA